MRLDDAPFMRFMQRFSIKTRIVLFMTAVFLLGSWSLVFYVSQLLRLDMQRLLGDQQYAAVSLLTAQLDEEFNGRLAALKTVAGEMTPALMAKPAALEAMLERRPVFYGLFNGGVLVLSVV